MPSLLYDIILQVTRFVFTPLLWRDQKIWTAGITSYLVSVIVGDPQFVNSTVRSKPFRFNIICRITEMVGRVG